MLFNKKHPMKIWRLRCRELVLGGRTVRSLHHDDGDMLTPGSGRVESTGAPVRVIKETEWSELGDQLFGCGSYVAGTTDLVWATRG